MKDVRGKTNDYLHFLSIATGSAYELGYLVGLSAKLGFIAEAKADVLVDRAGHIAASLTALIESLELAEEATENRPVASSQGKGQKPRG